MRHFASQSFFYENQHFYVFLDHIIIFQHFFELKKTRLEIPLRLVQVSARELRYLTISSIFDNFRIKTTPAEVEVCPFGITRG